MEAAIRTAYWMLTDENPKADLVKLTPVRGMDGIREAELEINGIPVRQRSFMERRMPVS